MYIGIDLGTTNSAIAGIKKSDVKIFKSGDGMDTFPSAIYIDGKGNRLYGRRAYDQAIMSPENTASKFKRIIGTSTPVKFEKAKLELTPEECSADILKQLIGQAYTESGEDSITGVVITIPAAFNQMQSEATLEAAKIAGMENVILLQEPVAATLATVAQAEVKNGIFLIYDLGGGTFDLALAQSMEGQINILAHEGIGMLGGAEFDKAIFNDKLSPWLLENFNLPDNFQGNEKYRNLSRRGKKIAEEAKIQLSTNEKAKIYMSEDEIRLDDESGEPIYVDIEITREYLEKIIKEYINKTIELCQKIIEDNGYTYEDIDEIVFIGGPTKTPYIRETVPQQLGIKANFDVDPMTAVACGAAIYCESREWGGAKTTRKKSRTTEKVKGKLGIEYKYSERTSSNKTNINLECKEDVQQHEIEVTSIMTGWNSGRSQLQNGKAIEVQLENNGENKFIAKIYDNTGKEISECQKEIIITKTAATSVGIPCTRTIAIKTKESREKAKNILTNVVEKGVLLPAKGHEELIALDGISSNNPESEISIEIYHNEGANEIELNQNIGTFKITGADLEKGLKIKDGDKIIFHWELSDNGNLQVEVECPSIDQYFTAQNFYVPQDGHQNFDMDKGVKVIQNDIENASRELEEAKKVVSDGDDMKELDKLQHEILNQSQDLEKASESADIKYVSEQTRVIRQQIDSIKHSPKNKKSNIENELNEIVDGFNKLAREFASEEAINNFDGHNEKAIACLKHSDDKHLYQAEEHIKEMETLYIRELQNNPMYQIATFHKLSEEIYLASDEKKYLELIDRGMRAIENEDFQELKGIIYMMLQMRVSNSATDSVPTASAIASIMASR